MQTYFGGHRIGILVEIKAERPPNIQQVLRGDS
jgi:hypothetical protein